jgi:hypothetical protein
MADAKITALTSYTPAIDTDVLPIVDVTTSTTKKITWANIKATLKAYFDTLYTLANLGGLASSSKATQAEVATGTDDAKYTTPLAVQPYANQSLYRQAIINGNFDVWQRGTSFTISTPVYTADRWRAVFDSSFVNQQIEDGVNILRFGRQNGNSSTNGIGVAQVIETANAKYLRSKSVTLSFNIRKGAGFSAANISARIATSATVDAAPSATNDLAGQTTFELDITDLTTSFQKKTLTATLPSTCNTAIVRFHYLPTGTADATDYVEITQVQLCAGSVALPFQPKSFAEELRDCQRYYQTRVVRTINGIMNYGLPEDLRTTPTTATASAGTIANATATGYQITHNANADSTVVLSAEL